MKYLVSGFLGVSMLLGGLGMVEAKTDPLKEEFKELKQELKDIKQDFKDAKQDFKQVKLDVKTQWNEYRLQSVPIPGTFLLFGGGLAGLVGWRMRNGKEGK